MAKDSSPEPERAIIEASVLLVTLSFVIADITGWAHDPRMLGALSFAGFFLIFATAASAYRICFRPAGLHDIAAGSLEVGFFMGGLCMIGLLLFWIAWAGAGTAILYTFLLVLAAVPVTLAIRMISYSRKRSKPQDPSAETLS